MAEPRIKFTRADYDLMPEELRVELIGGELLKMAPPTLRHQELAKNVFVALLEQIGKRRVFFGPMDFVIDDANVLVPDLVAFNEDTIPDTGVGDLHQADLVVEVLSPSTAARDRQVKSDLYLEVGVGEVWLVDAKKRAIETRTRTGLRLVQGNEPAVSSAIPGFAVEASDLF